MLKISLALLLLSQLVPAVSAEAQRATMNVSAYVLPSREALASGNLDVRQETGHTITATASVGQLSARRLVRADARRGDAGRTPERVEVDVDIDVRTNVHFQVEIRGDSASEAQRVHLPDAGPGPVDTSRRMRILLPNQEPSHPTSLSIVVTAGSIT